MRPRVLSAGLVVLISACSQQATHIPNPVLLPVEAVRAGASNLVYQSKRNKVKRFIVENYATLEREMLGQGGPTERAAMDLAGIPQPKQFGVHQDIQKDPELYFSGDPEPLVVILMVNGN